METRAGYLIVGTFVLLSIVGILGFFLWIAKLDIEYEVNYYTIYFPGSVTGLSEGGSVNYLGVPVGMVKKIELDSEKLESVKVTISIKKSIPIKEDVFASLEMQGLTGYKFVQICGGSQESPLLKAKPGEKYPVIPSRYSGVEEIMTTLPRMVNKFTNLVDRMSATFNEENRARFSNTLKNLDVLSAQLSESGGSLKEALESTHKAMTSFDRELQVLSQSTQRTLTKVDTSAQDIADFLKENKIALDTVTQTGSYAFLQTLTEMREMVITTTRFFEKLEENPRRLFFKTEQKGVSVPQQ